MYDTFDKASSPNTLPHPRRTTHGNLLLGVRHRLRHGVDFALQALPEALRALQVRLEALLVLGERDLERQRIGRREREPLRQVLLEGLDDVVNLRFKFS